MNFIELFFLFFGISFFIFFVFVSLHETFSEKYTTNITTECNDNNGDLIVGNITCYEKIQCSDVWKFMNKKECENYLK